MNPDTKQQPDAPANTEAASMNGVEHEEEPTIYGNSNGDEVKENLVHPPEAVAVTNGSVKGEVAQPSEIINNQNSASGSAESAVDLQKKMGLQPTAIVLAKVKGYRAWPAMVLDENILPENIRKMKPKSIKLTRKMPRPVIIVPVRFFSDDTYIWIKSCDLKILSPKEIEDFLLKRINSKKDTLIDAYKLAQNPPDMGEFNKWGSQGPPEFTDSPDEEDDELEAEKPPKKVLKLSLKLKKPAPASRAKSSGKPPSTSKVAPARVTSSKAYQNGLQKDLSGLEDDEPDSDSLEGFDSDWGLEDSDNDMESGNYIFDNQQEQKKFNETFPRAAYLSAFLEQFQSIFKDIHKAISPQLISGEIGNEKQILAKLRETERLLASANTPLVAFTKSALFRVLLLALHKPKDRFDYPAIREAIERIFNQMNLSACEITEEDMVIKTKDNTPLPTENKAEDGVVVVD
ncbi:hypothetical protein OXX79_001023 [Metschnikowia pulcherrima]